MSGNNSPPDSARIPILPSWPGAARLEFAPESCPSRLNPVGSNEPGNLSCPASCRDAEAEFRDSILRAKSLKIKLNSRSNYGRVRGPRPARLGSARQPSGNLPEPDENKERSAAIDEFPGLREAGIYSKMSRGTSEAAPHQRGSGRRGGSD